MKKVFLNNLKSFFPAEKTKWKMYFCTSLPVILAAMIFALNAFVDNFMSTNIAGGNQALSYANTWTEIEIGIISLTTIVGSALFAQYLGKHDVNKMKEVINIRIIFSLFIALIFAIPTIITPDNMVLLISGFDENILPIAFNNAIIYIRLITISWILNAIWFTASMILREKHHGFASFISSLISLILNIVLNSIFIFGFNLGIEFLAISTIISNICALAFVILFVIIKDKEILINPLKIFKVSKHVMSLFFKRTTSFILLTIGSLMVTIRFIFWNLGYPTGSIGNPIFALSAASILGITGMFFNIFWTTFESINANVAIYVGKELGLSNFEIAKKNAKELQGFHTTIAIVLGLLLFAFSFAIEKMYFLANGYKESLIQFLNDNGVVNDVDKIVNQGVNEFMSNLKYSLWPLAIFMPLFIWFITKSRVISAGGLTNTVAIIESVSGLIQIGWLCAICFGIKKGNNLDFPWAYFIFFLSDIFKLIVYEVVFLKVNWTKNITHEHEIITH